MNGTLVGGIVTVRLCNLVCNRPLCFCLGCDRLVECACFTCVTRCGICPDTRLHCFGRRSRRFLHWLLSRCHEVNFFLFIMQQCGLWACRLGRRHREVRRNGSCLAHSRHGSAGLLSLWRDSVVVELLQVLEMLLAL